MRVFLASTDTGRGPGQTAGIVEISIQACVHAVLGEKDEAIAILEQTYEKHAGVSINLRTFPWLWSLHGDPRFEELVRKVGFPFIPGAKKN